MIRLPDGFIPTPFPGYFIHVKTRAIFSIKSGTMKSLKKSRVWIRYPMSPTNEFKYSMSVNGQRRHVTEAWIHRQIEQADHTAEYMIPISTI